MYMRVRWLHAIQSEPVCIYSEVDHDRWERRKVEVYANGRMGFADDRHSGGGSMLSIEPLPSLREIAADSQFDPSEISKVEFETVWTEALSQRG